MNDYSWSLTIKNEQETRTFTWVPVYFEDQEPVWYPEITKPDGSQVDFYTAALVKDTVSAYRVYQLRNEDPALQTESYLLEGKTVEDVILDLVERAGKGEYLGQHLGGGVLYVQEVAKLLNVSPEYVMARVATLIKRKQIGLSGNIFISYEEYEQNFKELYEETGHHRLTMTNWGYWSCASCGKNGGPDDDLRAEDIKCLIVADGTGMIL